MASCKDCLHKEACNHWLKKENKFLGELDGFICEHFKDCSKFVELPSANLPVKVYLSDDIDKNYVLRDYFYKSDNRIFMMIISCIETQKYFTRKLSDFSKTVFLTREEAEQALKEAEQ